MKKIGQYNDVTDAKVYLFHFKNEASKKAVP